ncbi:hypothetical protein ACFV98_40180 [Streptomyces violascens]|uniref:hypothetical protein n=1 Tax=Streptomyces violascens TaxID=67381 RepID=UPI00365FFEF3
MTDATMRRTALSVAALVLCGTGCGTTAPAKAEPAQVPAGPCALKWHDNTDNIGVPTPPGRWTHSTGTVKALTLFVDFPDVPDTEGVQARYDRFFPAAAEYFKAASYGRLDYRPEPVMKYLRMPKPFTAYGLKRGASYDARIALVKDAIAAADPDVDFSTYTKSDLVNIIVTPRAGTGQDLAATHNLTEPIATNEGPARCTSSMSGTTTAPSSSTTRTATPWACPTSTPTKETPPHSRPATGTS